MKRIALLLAALLLCAGPAGGQDRVPSPFAPAAADARPPPGRLAARLGARTLAATGGWLVGAVAGGLVGSFLPGCGDCDDSGLIPKLAGAALGGAAGAALAGSLPDLGDPCTRRGRLAGSLVGSGLGVLLGAGLAYRADNLFAVPVLTVAGAVAGSFPCRPSPP